MATKPSSTAIRPQSIRENQKPKTPKTIKQQEKRIEEVLSFPILLFDKITQSIKEAEAFKFGCSEVGKQVDRLCQMLRYAVRLATSTATGTKFYDRPLRRIAPEVSKNLEKSLTLVKKCRQRSIIRRVVTIVSAADFRKLLELLDSSVADMKWVLSIFEAGGGGVGGGITLTLPPMLRNDPIISWIWSFIASLCMGQLQDKIEAANELASLAKDNDRNKQIICEEGAILPLLKMLKDSSSVEGQIASASALYVLANNGDRVRAINGEFGVPIIVQVLGESPMRVQIRVANLIAKMAEHCPLAQEDFARENAVRLLVTLLSFDFFMDDCSKVKTVARSISSLVEIAKEMEMSNSGRSVLGLPSLHSGGSFRGGNHRNERENEKPEMKLRLKISCAEALWMLARKNVQNSRRIMETKGLLCLAKIVEAEQGELQSNCLMTLMEITAAAESDADLRRSTFKSNSPASKAVVDQLIRLIKELNNPTLHVVAIRAIGSLARTFPARDTRVIRVLVEQLNHENEDVLAEAVIALEKFVCPDNFLCVEHSKTIAESGGVPFITRLLKGNGRAVYLRGLILICHLAIHAGNSEGLERGGMLNTFEGLDRLFIAQHSELKELVPKAIYHLSVFQQSFYAA